MIHTDEINLIAKLCARRFEVVQSDCDVWQENFAVSQLAEELLTNSKEHHIQSRS